MRKVDDGEEKRKKKRKKKIMMFIVATNVIASRLPERRTLVPKEVILPKMASCKEKRTKCVL